MSKDIFYLLSPSEVLLSGFHITGCLKGWEISSTFLLKSIAMKPVFFKALLVPVSASRESKFINLLSLVPGRHQSLSHVVNSLTPGKFEWNFKLVIFKWISVINGCGISCEIALMWMSLDFTDNQSTLVQVMAWCHQATSHYLSQCCHRFLLPHGVTRPQWVNPCFAYRWVSARQT